MVLVGMLSGLSGLLKIKDATDIDSAVFKLHYKFTAAFLFSFCLVVSAKGLVGDPINCAPGSNSPLPADVLNSFCWIHTTFTLPKHLHNNFGKAGNKPIYPGIGTDNADDQRSYHAYYQWVPFVLFLQGILFYAPHWLWRALEGGKINILSMGLSTPLMNKEEKREKIKILADYLHSNLHLHNMYACKYFFCEILNFLNVVSCFCLLGNFIGGMFLNFGVDVVNYFKVDDMERSDPLIVLFPRVTKCAFRKYGYSGSIETHDFLCILPLNIINEKIFIFLWFWFVILIVFSSLAILYQFAILSIPYIRVSILYRRAKPKFKGFVKIMSKKLQIGDCFVLNLLSKNMDFLTFQSLLEELYIALDPKELMLEDMEMKTNFLHSYKS